MKRFWRWVYKLSIAKLTDREGVEGLGVPGIRDPESICKGFSPGELKNRGFMHCDGDGHYLCGTCKYLQIEKE